MNIETVAIIGAGAWGQALAFLSSKRIKNVLLWHRPPEKIFSLPAGVSGTTNKEDLQKADLIFCAVPSQQMRSVSLQCGSFIKKDAVVLSCAKGIEHQTLLLMTEILQQTIPDVFHGVLSGPNLSGDVLQGLPTAATIALEGKTPEVMQKSEEICRALESSLFRLYWGNDPTGMQIAGAVKNILAVGCGIIIGQGLGENARAALITRGLNEIVKIGVAREASLETFMGLTGIGDLVLTCTSFKSRNFQFGYQLSKGMFAPDKDPSPVATTEGITNAGSILAFARSLNVEVPIIETIHDVIQGKLSIKESVERLMNRPLSAE
jgi:glycerol-3-phosphate dehydrogenase (NAD(P)+)